MVPAYTGKDYEEMMLNCLQCCNFNRDMAVSLFLKQYPPLPEMLAYAKKLYRKVMASPEVMNNLIISQNELISSNQRALDIMFHQAQETGNWDNYIRMSQQVAKNVGLERPNNTQIITNNLNVSKEELLRRVSDRARQIEGIIGGTGEGLPVDSGDKE